MLPHWINSFFMFGFSHTQSETFVSSGTLLFKSLENVNNLFLKDWLVFPCNNSNISKAKIS